MVVYEHSGLTINTHKHEVKGRLFSLSMVKPDKVYTMVYTLSVW